MYKRKSGHVFYTRAGELVTSQGYPLTVGSSGGGGTSFGDLLPASDNTYIIGNNTKRWKSLTVQGNLGGGIYLTQDNGFYGHIVGIASANRVYTLPDFGGTFVMSDFPLDITGPGPTSGQVLVGVTSTTAQWQTPAAGSFSGDILPASNNTYVVGNGALNWKSFSAGTDGYKQFGTVLINRYVGTGGVNSSIGIGTGNVGSTTGSSAFGDLSDASGGNNNTAVGYQAVCNAGASNTALGAGATAINGSIAIGAGASASTAGTCVVRLNGFNATLASSQTAARTYTLPDITSNIMVGSTSSMVVTNTATAGDVLTALSGTTSQWAAAGAGSANVTNTNGPFTIAGTPTSGQIIVATGGSTGNWATPSSGNVTNAGGPITFTVNPAKGTMPIGDSSVSVKWVAVNGTYTPTVTNVDANLASVTVASPFTYMIVGQSGWVTGDVNITEINSNNTDKSFDLTVPVGFMTANFTNSYDANGLMYPQFNYQANMFGTKVKARVGTPRVTCTIHSDVNEVVGRVTVVFSFNGNGPP
jgi:hypothetical protein